MPGVMSEKNQSKGKKKQSKAKKKHSTCECDWENIRVESAGSTFCETCQSYFTKSRLAMVTKHVHANTSTPPGKREVGPTLIKTSPKKGRTRRPRAGTSIEASFARTPKPSRKKTSSSSSTSGSDSDEEEVQEEVRKSPPKRKQASTGSGSDSGEDIPKKINKRLKAGEDTESEEREEVIDIGGGSEEGVSWVDARDDTPELAAQKIQALSQMLRESQQEQRKLQLVVAKQDRSKRKMAGPTKTWISHPLVQGLQNKAPKLYVARPTRTHFLLSPPPPIPHQEPQRDSVSGYRSLGAKKRRVVGESPCCRVGRLDPDVGRCSIVGGQGEDVS